MGKAHANKPTEQREGGSAYPQEDAEKIGDALAGINDRFVPVLLGMLASYKNLPTTIEAPPLCTWSLAETSGRALLHQTINGSSPSLWDLCEKGPFEITVDRLAVKFTEWEPEDKPGELVSGPMFYLLGPNSCYHSAAEGLYQSLQQLAHLEGPPPWDPPVILRAERAPTRNRRVRLALVYIGRG